MPSTGHVRGAQKTEGSVALARCGRSQEQIARETGARYSVVGNWTGGHRRPGRAWRDRLLHLYGIPVDGWEKPIEFAPPEIRAGLLQSLPAAETQTSAPGTREPDASRGAAANSPATTAEALIAQIESFRAKVEVDPLLTLSEKAKVLGSCASTLALVYKLTGAAGDIPESKLLKTPAWKRVECAVVAALEPWPDAMRAVGVALQELAGA